MAERSAAVDGDAHLDPGAGVHLVPELALVECVDHPADGLLGVVLHMSHVCLHDVEAHVVDHRVDLLDPLFTGGDLGVKVGEVGVGIAGRVARVSQQPPGFLLAQAASTTWPAGAVDQQPVVEQHALFLDGSAQRRHRAWRQSADLGVVTARGDVEQHVLPRPVVDRCDDRDVRQVGASVVRIVDRVDVSGLHLAGPALDHLLHACAHRAQVDRHVRCVGDQVAVGIEERTGEVQPLLDVDRLGRRLQPYTHLLGDGHEQVVEDLQLYGVDLGADVLAVERRSGPFDLQVTALGECGQPTTVDNRRRVGFGDDRRTCHRRTRLEVFPLVQGGVPPRAVCVHPDRVNLALRGRLDARTATLDRAAR